MIRIGHDRPRWEHPFCRVVDMNPTPRGEGRSHEEIVACDCRAFGCCSCIGPEHEWRNQVCARSKDAKLDQAVHRAGCIRICSWSSKEHRGRARPLGKRSGTAHAKYGWIEYKEMISVTRSLKTPAWPGFFRLPVRLGRRMVGAQVREGRLSGTGCRQVGLRPEVMIGHSNPLARQEKSE